ncbi:MAG: hydrogenase maturation nickel metallochaperone HypA [Planctomycetes bacterium]|nr:hydrogenase maturation nickel metallochaperone HypA [Planctomycetota bacterium]
MHELSIALSLLDVAAEEAQRQGAARVLAVHLKLGPLSGVIREALLSAWELAREDSPLAEARLEIEDVPLAIVCPACRAERPVESLQRMCCTECGTFSAEITSGRELELTALEIAP